jgi:hypothetical protein
MLSFRTLPQIVDVLRYATGQLLSCRSRRESIDGSLSLSKGAHFQRAVNMAIQGRTDSFGRDIVSLEEELEPRFWHMESLPFHFGNDAHTVDRVIFVLRRSAPPMPLLMNLMPENEAITSRSFQLA